MGYCPWGCKKSDTTEVTEHALEAFFFFLHRKLLKDQCQGPPCTVSIRICIEAKVFGI